jgi:outer membrane protein assembly factor BamD
MKRGAYLAAANRCVGVVEQYQRTPAVKDALLIMIEAYEKLGLEKLATDTKRVLAINQQNGSFKALEEEFDEEKTIGRVFWDYLELDKN